MPWGILNLLTGLVVIVLGTSHETSDFWVDCLRLWWERSKGEWPGIRRLVLRLDNGPANASNRRVWLKRLVQFASESGLELRLVYYPPYHSKYNPIERVWGALERHWNGTLLRTLADVKTWAQSMTWEGTPPEVECLEGVYPKGARVPGEEMRQYLEQVERSSTLPKWDVTIKPKSHNRG